PTPRKETEEKTISLYVFKLARLGGYLGRSCDGPPGIKVIWRGLRSLMDIEIGYNIGRTCG
ncbi:MAG: IS4 family transposase, partial [Planctomycetes bacterium]|nr:IS4 family transposase [Planctomycetota bacterium]